MFIMPFDTYTFIDTIPGSGISACMCSISHVLTYMLRCVFAFTFFHSEIFYACILNYEQANAKV